MCLGGAAGPLAAIRALALATHLGPTVAVTTSRPCWGWPRGSTDAADRPALRRRPRRSGVHRLEQRLARRRPGPGRRAGRQAGRPGGRDRPPAAVAALSAALLAVVLSLLLGVVPGLLLLVLVASGWAYNAGLKRTAASVVPYVDRLRGAAGRRRRRGARDADRALVAGGRRRRARRGGAPGQRRPRPGGRPGDRGAGSAAPTRRTRLGLVAARPAAGGRLGRPRARSGRATDDGGVGGPGAGRPGRRRGRGGRCRRASGGWRSPP